MLFAMKMSSGIILYYKLPALGMFPGNFIFFEKVLKNG